jgi:hypothetical protein
MSEDQSGLSGSGEDQASSVRRPPAPARQAPQARPAMAPHAGQGSLAPRESRLALLRAEVEALEAQAALAEEAHLLARKQAAEDRIRQSQQPEPNKFNPPMKR